ncbi:DUF1361 domain-containing protein [Maribacter sp.]|nr:DUF1361 domain-containing protein [Maribacter sp.]
MNTLLLKLENRNVKLMLSIGFALALYLARVKLTQSTYFGFLVWNLFLAAVPYLISQFLLARSEYKKVTKALFLLGFGAWLLFLPNSPYIITDLVHLHDDGANLLWLDMFLIFVFALNGLLLGLLSLLDISKLMQLYTTPKTTSLILFVACMASGYGIYLGRFLRFNSWDIATKPRILLIEIGNSFGEPKVWLITLAFGGFLWILFQLLQSLYGTDRREVLA